MAIPLQSEVDFSNPEERFVWALRGMEFRGTPVAVPEVVLREWSKHLSNTGFVHVSELEGLVREEDLPNKQTIHYQPPLKGQNHDLNTAGGWVDVNEPVVAPTVRSSDSLSPQEKALLIAEFKEDGLID